MKGRSVEKVVLTLYNAYSYTGMAVNDGDQTQQAQGFRGQSGVVRGGPGWSGGSPGWSGGSPGQSGVGPVRVEVVDSQEASFMDSF